MEGYDVVTVDDHKIGKVVEESGDFLIVEQGLLKKSKHALPREFAHVDDSEQQVRVTVPKDVIAESPKLDDDLDRTAVYEHYGLAPSTGPGTEGYGETDPGDPSRSSEEQAARQGIQSTEEQRARTEGQGSDEPSPDALLETDHGYAQLSRACCDHCAGSTGKVR